MKERLPAITAALGCLCALLLGSAGAQEAAESDVPYSRRGADTCLGCHDDRVTLAVFNTKHAVPADSRGPFGAGQLQCEACHGPGGNHGRRLRRGEERPPVIRFGADSETPVGKQNEMCLGCHQGDLGFGWHGGPHDDNQVACADCHTSHAPHDAVLDTMSQPDVCYTCHNVQRTAALKPYAHPLHEGKMSCTACHSPHGATTEVQLVRQTTNQTCYQCHAEKRGPFVWEHAPVAEDCSTCHEPHGSNYPGMLTQRGPWLCQACHSQAGHPSLAQDADGLAANMPSQFLLGQNCMNCHSQVHGSNHPSGSKLMR